MKLLKKISLFLLVMIISCSLVISIKADSMNTDTLVIHYFRYNGDYSSGWGFWVWQNAPVNSNGATYDFDKDENGKIVTDDYGAVCTIDLTSASLAGSSRLGIIVKKGEWVAKDIDTDRFFDVEATSEGGVIHRYLVEGDERIGTSIDDVNGPDRSDKVLSSFFSSSKLIKFTLSSSVSKENVELYANDEKINCNVSISGKNGTITLNENADLSKSYTLKVTFNDQVKESVVSFDGLYDTQEFEETFTYTGDDLGCSVTSTKTVFKLWAPISNNVIVNIYDSGTVKSGDKARTLQMTKGEKGVWSCEVSESLHGKYYTYTVTNGNKSNEVVDPYAKSCGINGLRGMCVDFSKTNPEGFEYNKRANNITNPTDAIIYELHIRDLTSHSSWKGTEANRGKLLGLAERGTTYTYKDTTVTTGLDHILELGVTHVQILPFYDHGIIDENKKNVFNWGYMPENYNCIEGSYSSNPSDGLVRVRELKEVSKVFYENNLAIIMDVVFNHTGKSADSNFNLIVPGYYHRLDQNGNYCNGSGCGNETASNRSMMRKFIVDSVKFWATEYNISGFRFDLMGLHDVETMNEVYSELQKIDKNILVYGEPWNAGSVQLPDNEAADKRNLSEMSGVGAFNDEIRDAIKGSVFNQAEGGFIQGNSKVDVNKLRYGVVGGIEHSQINSKVLSYEKAWNSSPTKTINYVSAHDNNTLYDKIMLTTTSKQRELRVKMQQQANAIVLTSQGIPFLHAGVEMLRSKPLSGGGYDHNSYESPDSVNQLRWDLKANANNLSCFNYYKDMISLRRNHPAFRMTDVTKIQESLKFVYTDQTNLLAYQISNCEEDSWNEILVIHANSSKTVTSITLPESNASWTLVANQTGVNEEGIQTYESGAEIKITANETLILYSGLKSVEKGGCSCSNAAFSNILAYGFVFASSFTCYAIIRRKRLF